MKQIHSTRKNITSMNHRRRFLETAEEEDFGDSPETSFGGGVNVASNSMLYSVLLTVLLVVLRPYEVQSFVIPSSLSVVSTAKPSSSMLNVASFRTWFSIVGDDLPTSLKTTPRVEWSAISISMAGDRHIHNKTDLNGQNATKKSSAKSSHEIELGDLDANSTAHNRTNPTDHKEVLDLAEKIRSEKKRQKMQYGIFFPSNIKKTTSSAYSSLKNPAFPNYSGLANTLSTTIQNKTTGGWKIKPQTSYVQNPQYYKLPRSDASATILSTLQPNDTITVADLQSILQSNGYLRQQDLTSSDSLKKSNIHLYYQGDGIMEENSFRVAPSTRDSQAVARSKSGVAFPQPSILDSKSLRRGTTIAGGIIGMILGTTLLPNLWLIGLLLGGLYGNDLVARSQDQPPSDFVGRNLMKLGLKLTSMTLQLVDYCKTLWFLYKTGELSYQYYKQYEAMDKRFQIQSKMDAWNARFQKGKQNFDAWEQENEIGRTILAGLRTVWLVDERSKRRAKQTSRYRVVQYFYDAKFWIRRRWRKTWRQMRSREWIGSVQDFWKGIQTDVWVNSGGLGTRFGAVFASLAVVNLTGALFAISPGFLALIAISLGVVWPSWVPELLDRLSLLAEETRARGRGEHGGSLEESNFLMRPRKGINTARLLGRYDKTKYHSYRRLDGSKQFYRTGRSMFGPGGVWRQEDQKQKTSLSSRYPDAFSSGTKDKGSKRIPWPFSRSTEPKRRIPGKEQWGIWKMN